MGEVVVLLEMLGVLIGVPVGYLWLGRRARRRGIGGSVLAPLEEIWDPTAYNTQIEVHVQSEQAAPAPEAGDPPKSGVRSVSRR